MKAKQIVRTIVDVVMLLALLCLMAYQVMGEALHEYIGVGMTVMLIAHHFLNNRWYRVLFRGNTMRTESCQPLRIHFCWAVLR